MHKSIQTILNRRSFAKAAIAAPLATCVTPANAQPHDPLPAMVAEWTEFEAQANATGLSLPEDQALELYAARSEMSRRIAETQPATPEGVKAYLD